MTLSRKRIWVQKKLKGKKMSEPEFIICGVSVSLLVVVLVSLITARRKADERFFREDELTIEPVKTQAEKDLDFYYRSMRVVAKCAKGGIW